ncbi:hypothetical protein WJX73_006742 [Symbiochloris irregularis]|uniref:Uncharacterized protein n=1 Tax=Symbiochloris irregularis TaxID=706552 RepID=A0AAW1P1Z1_9CHLO
MKTRAKNTIRMTKRRSQASCRLSDFHTEALAATVGKVEPRLIPKAARQAACHPAAVRSNRVGRPERAVLVKAERASQRTRQPSCWLQSFVEGTGEPQPEEGHILICAASAASAGTAHCHICRAIKGGHETTSADARPGSPQASDKLHVDGRRDDGRAPVVSPIRMVSPLPGPRHPPVIPAPAVHASEAAEAEMPAKPHRTCRRSLPAHWQKLERGAVADAKDLDYSASDDESQDSELAEGLYTGAPVDMQAYWEVLHEAAPHKRPALWRQMQQIVLQATAAQALRVLKALVRQQTCQNSTKEASSSSVQITSGISYLVASRGQQGSNRGQMAPLPHMVIRPCCAPAKRSQLQDDMLALLQQQASVSTVLPWKDAADDGQIKQYLLEPSQRADITSAQGAKLARRDGSLV